MSDSLIYAYDVEDIWTPLGMGEVKKEKAAKTNRRLSAQVGKDTTK